MVSLGIQKVLKLARCERLVVKLGHLSFTRAGPELLFQFIADRDERRSRLITSNLADGD